MISAKFTDGLRPFGPTRLHTESSGTDLLLEALKAVACSLHTQSRTGQRPSGTRISYRDIQSHTVFSPALPRALHSPPADSCTCTVAAHLPKDKGLLVSFLGASLPDSETSGASTAGS